MKILTAKYYKPGSLRFSPPPPHSHSPPPPSSPRDLFSPLGYFSPPAPPFSPTPRCPPSPPPPFSPSSARPPVCTSASAPVRWDGRLLQQHRRHSYCNRWKKSQDGWLKEIQIIKTMKVIKEHTNLPLIALSFSNGMTELSPLFWQHLSFFWIKSLHCFVGEKLFHDMLYSTCTLLWSILEYVNFHWKVRGWEACIYWSF